MTPESSVFDRLVGQNRVRDFLHNAAASDSLSHAYLFAGPPGSGKLEAAKALAAAALCADKGCGACDSCIRVSHGTHPDVRIYAPEGSQYLVDQIRDIVHDTSLAPIRSEKKIYILQRADLLGDAAANAFLKTLEEPPADVMIILLSRSTATVIPTILSRCQVVPFRRIPPSESVAMLVSLTGASEEAARGALAATGNVIYSAKALLMSSSRQVRRLKVLSVLANLETMDDLDVLTSAKELLAEVKVGLDDMKAEQEKILKEGADFLSKGSLDKLEKRQKRELTASEREGLSELFNITQSWLRDCLVLSEGVDELVMNADASDSTMRLSAVLTHAAAGRALAAVDAARERVSYNVGPQLATEAMLFDIREVLRCPR